MILLLDGGLLSFHLGGERILLHPLLSLMPLLCLTLGIRHLEAMQLVLVLLLILQGSGRLVHLLLRAILHLLLDTALPLAHILLDLVLAVGLQPLPQAVQIPIRVTAHLDLEVRCILLDVPDLLLPLHLGLTTDLFQLLLKLLELQGDELVDGSGPHRAGDVQLIVEEVHRLR